MYIVPIAMKKYFRVDNYDCACMVLPLNGFGSNCFMLVYGWFLLANGAYICIIAGIVYTSIEKISVDDPAC